jgi:hypothetical protein
MDRIVIEVEDNLAKRWRNAAPEIKQKVSQELDHFLSNIFKKEEGEIWAFLEQLRSKAEQKGFDDSILEQILNEK